MKHWRHDDAFGSFEMCEWQPQPGSPLHGVLERIWYWNGLVADPRERVFPDVTLELVVQLGPAYRPVEAGHAGDPFPLVCIEGLRPGAATIEAPRERSRVLGLRFTPPAACALLREPLGALGGRNLDLAAVVGAPAAQLRERCGAARDAEHCIANALDWVAARMQDVEPDPLSMWCTNAIVASGGRVRIEALARAAGVSAAGLARRFGTHVGMTPKRFARVARFRRTLTALGAGASLADIVHDAGYYDHAHLDAEFREHTGLAPTAYLKAKTFPGNASLSEPAP